MNYRKIKTVFLLFFVVFCGVFVFKLGVVEKVLAVVSNEYVLPLTGVCDGDTLVINGEIRIDCEESCQMVDGVGSCVQGDCCFPWQTCGGTNYGSCGFMDLGKRCDYCGLVDPNPTPTPIAVPDCVCCEADEFCGGTQYFDGECRDDQRCCDYCGEGAPTPTIMPPIGGDCNSTECESIGGMCTSSCPPELRLAESNCLDSCDVSYCCNKWRITSPTPTLVVSTVTPIPSPTATATPVAQFSDCGSCESMGGGCPRAGECRVVSDWSVCRENGQFNADGSVKVPCCLWDTANCTGDTRMECGTFFNNIRCDMCHRFDGVGCGDLDTNCGSGAPASVRLKSPPADSFVALGQEVVLSWYAFGEEGPYIDGKSCAEKLPEGRVRAADCRNGGEVKDDFAPYCKPDDNSDKNCWGYACVRGSLGIPEDWRSYQVLVKNVESGELNAVCTINTIPTDLYEDPDEAKTSCKYIPAEEGEYEWFVKASYTDPSTGIHAETDSTKKTYGRGSFRVVKAEDQTSHSCDDVNNKMTISWNEIPEVDSYALRVVGSDYDVTVLGDVCSEDITRPASDKYFCKDGIDSSQTSYTFDIEPGKTYTWWVSPVYDYESGSDGKIAGWGQAFGQDSTCEGNPTSTICSVDSAGNNLAHIFWTKPEDGTGNVDGGDGEVKYYVLRIKGQDYAGTDCTIFQTYDNRDDNPVSIFSTDLLCNSKVVRGSYDFIAEPDKAYDWWVHPIYRANEQYHIDWDFVVAASQSVCSSSDDSVLPTGDCEYCKLREEAEGGVIDDLDSLVLNDSVLLTTKGTSSEHIIMAKFRVIGGEDVNSWCVGNGLTIREGGWCETTNTNLQDEFFVTYTFINSGEHVIESMLYGEDTGWF